MSTDKNNRWSMWARSIARRHLRFTQRRDSLALVLLRLRSPLSIVRERWTFTTRLVRPRVQLAINAVLRHTCQHAKTEGAMLCVFAPLREKTTSSSSTTSRLVSQVEKQSRIERTIRDIRVSPTSANTNSSAKFERQTESPKNALTFVFERIKESHTSTHASRLEKLINQQARSTVERVILQSQRSETMRFGTNTMISRYLSTSHTEVTQSRMMKTVTAAPTRVIEKQSPVAPVPVTTVVESAPWLQDKVSVAGLNIDQITDQVVKQLDHRVIAARERMGRF